MRVHRPLVFSSSAYGYLQEAMCHHADLAIGKVERRLFPDGERYQRIVNDVVERNVVLIGGTIDDTATLEVFDLACALVRCGARTLTLIIPYFGYATMERAIKPGEVVTAKNRARLLSAIPAASLGNQLVMVDLHAEGIPYYFDGDTRPVHVYAKPVVMEAARRLGGKDFVLACTDAGRAKWVQSLANDMEVPASFVYKRRIDGETTEVIAVSAQVSGKMVIIYDDMIRTGGSLIGAARAYKAAGAREIAAITTHALLPGDSLQRIRDTGLFTTIVCTDSHPRALELQNDFLQVESIAGLLAGVIGGPHATD
ncbi:MAG: ribose-phosphate pyrophosphokinase [Candidatus Sericytochromatia bacterium]|nr:ribose-phosphate pyrophosphokinase [Candidatus Sericytochromatia bacterium]